MMWQQGRNFMIVMNTFNVYTMDTKLEFSPTKKVLFKKSFSTNNNQMIIENNPLNDEFDIYPI
jgi:hypothetical protein